MVPGGTGECLLAGPLRSGRCGTKEFRCRSSSLVLIGMVKDLRFVNRTGFAVIPSPQSGWAGKRGIGVLIWVGDYNRLWECWEGFCGLDLRGDAGD